MDAQQKQFVEEMARHFEAEGVPRIGGRIYGFLLLQEQPCSLDDLAERLDASKPSASTNARLLEQRGLVQRVTRPGDRRDYYEAAPDQTRTLELAVDLIRQRGNLLRRGVDVAPSSTSRARLAKMARFNEDGLERLQSLLREWRDK